MKNILTKFHLSITVASISLCLLVFSYSCKKEEPTTNTPKTSNTKTTDTTHTIYYVTGTVLDSITGKPVRNADIIAMNPNQYCSYQLYEKVAVTDSLGHFKFPYNFTNSDCSICDIKICVICQQKEYFGPSAPCQFGFGYPKSVQVYNGKSSNMTLKLVPRAYLKLKVKNSSPYNLNDNISISAFFYNTMCNENSIYSLSFSGISVDTTTAKSIIWNNLYILLISLLKTIS